MNFIVARVTSHSALHRTSRSVLLLCTAGWLTACDHGLLSDAPKYGETLPAELAAAAEKGSSPAAGMSAGPMAGGMSGRGGMGGMGGAGGQAAGSGGSIRGQIQLAPELADKVPANGVLFVYARRPGMDKGPPLASLKLELGTFPIPFELSEANVMMKGSPFSGSVSLSARLDSDGNAMTKLPGDLVGAMPQPVEIGSTDVALLLNGVL